MQYARLKPTLTPLAVLLLMVFSSKALATSAKQDPCAVNDWEGCHSLGWQAQQAGKLEIAARYYRKSCSGALPKSCNNLAWIFESQAKYDKMQEFLTKACDVGHKQACMHAAKYAARIDNNADVSRFYGKACQLGVEDGCLKFTGDQEPATAKDNHKCDRASEHSNCLNEAKALLEADDPKNAVILLSPLCDLSFEDSCAHLGIALELKRDWDRAVIAYEASCRQGHGKTCLRLGNFFTTEGLSAKGQEFFKLACEAGERLGCLRYIDDGDIVLETQQQNQSVLKECHNDGSVYQCIAAGKTAEGLGEFNEAISLFELACRLEEPFGCVSAAAIYHQLERDDRARELVRQACSYAFPTDCDAFRRSACSLGYGWDCLHQSH